MDNPILKWIFFNSTIHNRRQQQKKLSFQKHPKIQQTPASTASDPDAAYANDTAQMELVISKFLCQRKLLFLLLSLSLTPKSISIDRFFIKSCFGCFSFACWVPVFRLRKSYWNSCLSRRQWVTQAKAHRTKGHIRVRKRFHNSCMNWMYTR